MFEDLITEKDNDEEKVLVPKTLLKSLEYNVDTKQKLIEDMITEIVALKIELRKLKGN